MAAKEAAWVRGFAIKLLCGLALYIVALVASIKVLPHTPPGAASYAVALLPVLPALYIVAFLVRGISRLDELQRKIHLEAGLFAFLAKLIVSFAVGFLENAGLPRLNWTYVWPLGCACWSLGLGVAHRRYR